MQTHMAFIAFFSFMSVFFSTFSLIYVILRLLLFEVISMNLYIPFYKKRCFLLLLMALTFLYLAGCSKVPPQSPPPPQESAYEAFAPITDVVEGRRDIYLVLKSFQSQYWQQVIQGAADAGSALNCNIYLGGTYFETGLELQNKLLDEAVEQSAAAIILAPIDSSLQVDTVRQIRQQGIPVVLIDTILNSSDYDVCYMTDNLQAGELAAKEMLRQLQAAGVSENTPAQIAIQVGSSGSQTIVDRLAGFSQYWSKYAPAQWVVLDDVRCNNGDIEAAARYCLEFLNTYPDLKGVLGCNNGSSAGFARGLLETGRTDVAIVGFDYSDEIAQLISSGQYPASTVIQHQYDMGYLGVRHAVSILNGEPVQQKFIDTGVRVVNKNNVNDPDIQKILTLN